MRKRERENPCFICGHYHKYEEGEPCGICGHRLIDATEKSPQPSAFSTEVLPGFLYLGSYDNASRAELLKAQGISRILNTVPSCQNLYRNSFTYHCVKEDKVLPFNECVDFIDETEKLGARVLVHCMSGQSRSPAVVIAYLMRHKGWRLPESYQWVKDRRPSINLTTAVAQQLQEYESQVFGSGAAHAPVLTLPGGGVTFGFGYASLPAEAGLPTFGAVTSPPPPLPTPAFAFSPAQATPLSERPGAFVFGATTNGRSRGSQVENGVSDAQMDGT